MMAAVTVQVPPTCTGAESTCEPIVTVTVAGRSMAAVPEIVGVSSGTKTTGPPLIVMAGGAE